MRERSVGHYKGHERVVVAIRTGSADRLASTSAVNFLCFSTSSGMASESGTGATDDSPFSAEQLAMIDRLIAARVATPVSRTDGDPPASSSTATVSTAPGEALSRLQGRPSREHSEPGVPPNAAIWVARQVGGRSPADTRGPRAQRTAAMWPGAPGCSRGCLVTPAGVLSGRGPPWLNTCPCFSIAGPLPTFPVGTGTVMTSWSWPSAVVAPAADDSAAARPSLGTSAGTSPADIAQIAGCGAVPPKLVRRIVGKEYVDIWELLPESWQLEMESSCCHSKRPRRSLVTDINVWTECFATMAAILSTAFPTQAPHLFAYLRTITKASRMFESSAWASYDMAYRRQAANRGSLDWGIVDAALFNEAFAGRAKQIPRCRYCLSDTHSSPECLHSPTDLTNVGTSFRAGPRLAGQPGRPTSSEICRLFNAPGGSRCRFPWCRYAHLCARCKRPHPAADCSESKRQAGATGTPAGAPATAAGTSTAAGTTLTPTAP